MTAKLPCGYAWGHLDFKHNGFYAPCFRFRTRNFHGGGRIPELPSKYVNSEPWKEVRRQLRDGIWPEGCEDCRVKEECGMKSYRQKSLWMLEDNPEITESDEIVVQDIELKMQRQCNLSCKHCNVLANSQFEKMGKQNPAIRDRLLKEHDFNHLAQLHDVDMRDIPPPNVIDDLFEHTLAGVRVLGFTGGEPLMHKSVYEMLHRMIDDPRIPTENITLRFNTNLTMLKFKHYDLAEIAKHFKKIKLTVSLDGVHGLFEYFRVGADYDTVLKNLKNVRETFERDRTEIRIVCTTGTYQALYMEEISNEFHRLKNEYDLDGIFLTFVHHPKAQDIVNIDEDMKQHLLDNVPYNNFTKDFHLRLKNGERTGSPDLFRDMVMHQDQLHDHDASELAPKIFDYVY